MTAPLRLPIIALRRDSTALLSLASVSLTAVAITGESLYTLGAGALISAPCCSWFRGSVAMVRTTASTGAFIRYMLMMSGSCRVDDQGAVDSTLKDFSEHCWRRSQPRSRNLQLVRSDSRSAASWSSSAACFFSTTLKLLPWEPKAKHKVRCGRSDPGRHLSVDRPIHRRSRHVDASANGIVKIGVIVATDDRTRSWQFLRQGGSDGDGRSEATKYRYELVIRDSGPDPVRAKMSFERSSRGIRGRCNRWRHLAHRSGDEAVGHESADPTHVRVHRHVDWRWRGQLHEHPFAGSRGSHGSEKRKGAASGQSH